MLAAMIGAASSVAASSRTWPLGEVMSSTVILARADIIDVAEDVDGGAGGDR